MWPNGTEGGTEGNHQNTEIIEFIGMPVSGMLFAYLVGLSDKLLQKQLMSFNCKGVDEGGAGVKLYLSNDWLAEILICVGSRL